MDRPDRLQIRIHVADPAHAAMFPKQDLALQAAANLTKRYDARRQAERRLEALAGSPAAQRSLDRAVAAEERAVKLLREALLQAEQPDGRTKGSGMIGLGEFWPGVSPASH